MASSDSARVLVMGANGMLGNAVLRFFASSPEFSVAGSVRAAASLGKIPAELRARVVPGADAENADALLRLFEVVSPDIVVNCVGLVKQLADAEDPLAAIPLNSVLPHRLAGMCEVAGARLVHISTDCVFSGSKGLYREDDFPDARDLYGRTKLLGEVDYPHAVTLRTSIIGHEVDSAHGLIGWFLTQRGIVKGYRRAVFSGLPTVELARVIRDFVIPQKQLRGVYHVAAEPINKYDLLKLVRDVYGTTAEIVPDDHVVIDRSLRPDRFRAATGYVAPDWAELVRRMHQFQ